MECPPEHVDYITANDLLIGSPNLGKLDPQCYIITSVARVQNRPLRKFYSLEREGMIQEHGLEGLNESTFFHGSGKGCLMTLVSDRHGFGWLVGWLAGWLGRAGQGLRPWLLLFRTTWAAKCRSKLLIAIFLLIVIIRPANTPTEKETNKQNENQTAKPPKPAGQHADKIFQLQSVLIRKT